ncbi:hypothetical protein E4U42_003667 [Claviceps africana]|uniref:Uncharacterized protein n=1 Tax=Claviceps africana TaxID=83212 RepID=A0A8K0NGN7_9HYPO|nr:hypothetical protein E4U42_003667 [Claviceps africana]
MKLLTLFFAGQAAAFSMWCTDIPANEQSGCQTPVCCAGKQDGTFANQQDVKYQLLDGNYGGISCDGSGSVYCK